MVVLFMKDILTLINSVTEVVYVVSMHCGLPGLNYQDSQKKIFTHEGLSAHVHNNYYASRRSRRRDTVKLTVCVSVCLCVCSSCNCSTVAMRRN